MIRTKSSSKATCTTNNRFHRSSIPMIASRASSAELESTTRTKGSKKCFCRLLESDPVLLQVILSLRLIPDKGNSTELVPLVHKGIIMGVLLVSIHMGRAVPWILAPYPRSNRDLEIHGEWRGVCRGPGREYQDNYRGEASILAETARFPFGQFVGFWL
jgi:hypothetical protein